MTGISGHGFRARAEPVIGPRYARTRWRAPRLARDIQEFVKQRLAAHEYPRHVQFTDALPMTATGKVLRRELRARG